MGRVDGKVAFITGAARGQGRSHALRLAEEGADIIAVDSCSPIDSVRYEMPTTDDLDETAREVKARGRRIVTARADVRDLAALTDIVNRGVAELGRLDIVIANAGISTPNPTLGMDEAIWDEMIEINLTGVWKTLKASVPHIEAGGRGGSAVLVSSVAAFLPYGNTAHYSAAKAGLVALARILAMELAPQSIRVNTIHPTIVATPMVLNDSKYRLFCPDIENPTRADFESRSKSLNAMPVFAIEPEDISAAILYLVSEDGRYVTGSQHVVDAGAIIEG
jgi:SDR family mycofactocin-dependent oxidoreductase